MSDFNVGDRVRVTLEGTVGVDAQGTGRVRIDGARGDNWGWFESGLVEKLSPPLPTTPGSVVRVGQSYYTLQQDVWWSSPRAVQVNATIISGYDYEVIFDAGAV